MYCNRLDSVEDLNGEPGLTVGISICCVKSIKKFVVVLSSIAGVALFNLRGVGDGDREGDDRLRDVRGVDSACLPGVRVLVGLCRSFANTVISGISENVLAQVSSAYGCCSSGGIIALRISKPAWNADALSEGVRSSELPRLRGCGVVAPLLFAFSGDFLGEPDTFRVDGGGIISLLLRRCRLELGRECEDAALVARSGTFSLSSSAIGMSMMLCLDGVPGGMFSVFSSVMLPFNDASHCLLGLLLCVSNRLPTSVTNGELGGPSTSSMLGSISCADGDSIL